LNDLQVSFGEEKDKRQCLERALQGQQATLEAQKAETLYQHRRNAQLELQSADLAPKVHMLLVRQLLNNLEAKILKRLQADDDYRFLSDVVLERASPMEAAWLDLRSHMPQSLQSLTPKKFGITIAKGIREGNGVAHKNPELSDVDAMKEAARSALDADTAARVCAMIDVYFQI
jgi:hypothetical protein